MGLLDGIKDSIDKQNQKYEQLKKENDQKAELKKQENRENYEQKIKEIKEPLHEKKMERAEKEMEKGNLIYNTNSDIDSLAKQNIETMLDIQGHEAGSSWAKWSAILSMKPEAQAQAMLLKSITEEQKILIRQNEIIIKLLSQKQ